MSSPALTHAAAAGAPARDYERARERIVADLAAAPPGSPVRLAKRTSNLFRPRSPADGGRLRVDGLDRVIAVDPEARTADVGGMTTYEHLVDATLAHGLMPLVVPELKTITIGGAVTGLGVESTSFRNGLPHESVVSAEVLIGTGEIVRAEPGGEHADLFAGLPNSYGTLGYALRLTVELEPVQPYVRLRHLRHPSAELACARIEQVCREGVVDGDRVDFLDGVVFAPDEVVLTVGTFVDEAPATSDYTGRDVYYRSLTHRPEDHLTVRDYLWRWDTDWFWCSRAFGAQHPLLRRVWPASLRRSDVYWRLIAWDRRLGLSTRLDRLRGLARRESVVQDVEIPVGRVPEFLGVLDEVTGMRPVWLCPVRQRRPPPWPLFPLDPDQLYVNIGFWGTVPLAEGEPDGSRNRALERAVSELGGLKSLYSTAYFDRAEFDRLYNASTYRSLKQRYDPDGRLLNLYDKTVRGR